MNMIRSFLKLGMPEDTLSEIVSRMNRCDFDPVAHSVLDSLVEELIVACDEKDDDPENRLKREKFKKLQRTFRKTLVQIDKTLDPGEYVDIVDLLKLKYRKTRNGKKQRI